MLIKYEKENYATDLFIFNNSKLGERLANGIPPRKMPSLAHLKQEKSTQV